MVEFVSFEVTTRIGCPVHCIKYCPQEVLVKQYQGEKNLSLANFKKFISTVPTDVAIGFCGFVEPFVNRECPDMMLYAHDKGHEIVVATTLVGLTPKDADRILHIPFKIFTLHLPDAYGNANIRTTPEYLETLGKVLTRVENIGFMNMGKGFATNNNENIHRGLVAPIRKGRIFCPYHDKSNLQAMPNGDVYFCCITRGIEGKVGSMWNNTYDELASPEMFNVYSEELQKNPNSICHKCKFAYPYWWRHLERFKTKHFGDKENLADIAVRKIKSVI